jgi:hypothetical protein
MILDDTADIHTWIKGEAISFTKSLLYFAACSPHFSITLSCVQAVQSTYKLQQDTDIEYTSPASVIQLKTSLYNSVVLFYNPVLKIQITSPLHHYTNQRSVTLTCPLHCTGSVYCLTTIGCHFLSASNAERQQVTDDSRLHLTSKRPESLCRSAATSG